MLTFQALTYIEGNERTGGPIWNHLTGTLTPSNGCQTGSRYPTQLRGSAHPGKQYKTTRTWERFDQNVKRPGFYALAFYIFINSSRSKQNKQNPRHAFVDIGK